MKKKKIIIVDDEPLIPALMKEIIEETQEFEITAMISEKNEFLNQVHQHSFDAAILDISIGGREGGIELLREIKQDSIPLPIIMLSAHDEIYYAPKCLQEGARGYINKKYICTDMVRCLKEVLQGRLFVSSEKGEKIVKDYVKLYYPMLMESFKFTL